LSAIFPINWFQAYDLNLFRPYRSEPGHVDFDFATESSINSFGRTAQDELCEPSRQGCKTNVLQVWQPDQNALAMLQGFDPSTQIGALAQEINVDVPADVPPTDGCPVQPVMTRGLVDFCGDLKIKLRAITATRWHLPNHFTLGVYLPVTTVEVTNNIVDKTKSITSDDILTQQLVTGNLSNTVAQLGCLNINRWQHTGVGDLAVMADWSTYFRQARPLLTGVRTTIRFGINIPTARKTPINDVLPVAFGNESFGFILAAGLGLHFTRYLRAGLDFEFLYLLSRVVDVRVKTSQSQTDLLLLATAPALKEFGFTNRFNLFVETFAKGFAFNFTYQFWQHQDDKLGMINQCYSSAIANTAKSLQEWTIHNFIYRLSYDSAQHDAAKWIGSPYVAVYYKQPINGKNAFLANTMGVILNFTV
jgi:hypothetical protein